MARAGAATNLSTTSTAVFSSSRKLGSTGQGDGEPAWALRVTCPSGAAATLLANVPELHGTDFVTITAGSAAKTFYGKQRPLSQLNLKSASGTTSYEFEVMA
jgi:hypothetical protein